MPQFLANDSHKMYRKKSLCLSFTLVEMIDQCLKKKKGGISPGPSVRAEQCQSYLAIGILLFSLHILTYIRLTILSDWKDVSDMNVFTLSFLWCECLFVLFSLMWMSFCSFFSDVDVFLFSFLWYECLFFLSLKWMYFSFLFFDVNVFYSLFSGVNVFFCAILWFILDINNVKNSSRSWVESRYGRWKSQTAW